jgi:hypothetical protein
LNQSSADLGILEESRFQGFGISGAIKSSRGAGVFGGSEAHGTIGVQGSSA